MVPTAVDTLEMLRARIYLCGVLPLLEDLVEYDHEARARIVGKTLVVQFEVKRGPTAHVIIDGGHVTHGTGPHESPTVRLRFRKPQMLNRMFAGENVRPGLRKGFRYLRFLLKDFPALAARLRYYLEGEGSSAEGRAELERRFLVGLRLRALVAGTAVVAEHDGWLADIADQLPVGSVRFIVRPDGPRGTVAKMAATGNRRFSSAFNDGDGKSSVVMEFTDLDAAWRVLSGKAGFEEAASLGDVEMAGNIMLADHFNIIMRRLVAVTGL